MTCPCPASALAANDEHHAVAARRRKLLCAAVIAATTAISAIPAAAADWPGDTLRGSYTSSGPVRWEGFNVGGQLGLANADANFSNTTSDFVSYALRQTALGSQKDPASWTALPSQQAHGRSYGGFVGYNFQWSEFVLGVDVAYNRVSGMNPSSSGSINRTVTPTTGTDTVIIGGQASIKLNDYGTVRGRAGYAFGQFLGYGFVGVAVGRFDYSRDLFLSVTGTNSIAATVVDGKSNAISAGVTTGLGVDVAVMPNVFLRGEWEFNAFAPVVGIRFMSNTVRAAVGLRF